LLIDLSVESTGRGSARGRLGCAGAGLYHHHVSIRLDIKIPLYLY
jgi:hypothetical protein